ncbi:hypothetical protein [Amycolatopsis sp. NPDC051903]|uniref:hypothetical protein n=1 Tax=Amycolatopsis sp. NPDC051903 TaxID=3363936 RepID=UPI0037A0ECC6
MAVIRFHVDSALSPADAFAVLTDFGPARAEHWSSIDAEHFTVHDRGDTWAEVTEGTGAAWERERYEWDATRRRVTATTLDSKLFGAGGGWVFRLSPDRDGTRVEVELTRTPATVKGKLLASVLRIVGPASLRKSLGGPLKAR